MDRLKTLSLWIFFGLLAYMPLHIFLSTWLGTSWHVLELAKVAKDIILIVGFAATLLLSVRQSWFKSFLKDRLVWLIGAYAVITLLLAVIKPTDADAEILGVVYNLRFFVYFLYATLLSRLFEKQQLHRVATKIVLLVAVPVLAFGVLQYLALPDSALTHVGYSRENGVLPAFFIDDKPDLERAMSTLRDPNSFGSYCIIILSLALVYLLYAKSINVRRVAAGLVGLSLLCLVFTFSRSAWLGAVTALVVIGLMVLKQRRGWRVGRGLVVGVLVFTALSAAGLYLARDTYLVKNIILHADESTALEDPNQLRLRFWRESYEAAVDNPLGYGPGTAGLASIRNDEKTVLNENYYLQILHEVGAVGLLLFLAILTTIAWRLYRSFRVSAVNIALLAAFIGLAVTNFLVHIWSNEVVAYVWWGLAGLLLVAENGDARRPRVGKN